MAIKTKPSSSSQRRGRTIFQISGHSTRSFTEVFFFSVAGVAPDFNIGASLARAPTRVASFDPVPDGL
jgi:N-formylglutamate amidohydrolase